jgi:hypothetical protein
MATFVFCLEEYKYVGIWCKLTNYRLDGKRWQRLYFAFRNVQKMYNDNWLTTVWTVKDGKYFPKGRKKMAGKFDILKFVTLIKNNLYIIL